MEQNDNAMRDCIIPQERLITQHNHLQSSISIYWDKNDKKLCEISYLENKGSR